MPGSPHHTDYTAVAVVWLIQQTLDGGHLPV